MNSLVVSVIVMTFNRPQQLRRCLESLAAQTVAHENFEVVLVDGSGTPVTDLVAEFSGQLRLVHLPGPNLGVARNRNRGAERASALKIAFIDDDCVAHPDWLRQLTAALDINPHSIVGGGIESPQAKNAFADAGQVITEAVDAFYNPPGQEPRFFPGLNFALERERYLDIGGCDKRFRRLAAEDRDFVDRWRLAGGKLVACRAAIVRHEHRATFRGFVRQYFNYGRGAWRYHSVRCQRGSGRISEDARLHCNLPYYLRASLRKLSLRRRFQVVVLIGVWQVANLAGFVWQAVREALIDPSA